jgi:ring-1,2-phenylacetyl-CoA epoxidase subunit PaaD
MSSVPIPGFNGENRMSQSAAVITIGEKVPKSVLEALDSVADPEIPVLTIRDLGILRGVHMEEGKVVVTITPTYSGCPAMIDIRDSIEIALRDAGVEQFSIETCLSPAWTTDWMSEEGCRKLLEYGIAPPPSRGEGAAPTSPTNRHENPVEAAPSPRPVACPQCGSEDTRLVSEFGSTSCKALRQCNSCLEPFDHFKCH